MKLTVKAATVVYYNRRGSIPEHAKYVTAHLVLCLHFLYVINAMNAFNLIDCIVLAQKVVVEQGHATLNWG